MVHGCFIFRVLFVIESGFIGIDFNIFVTFSGVMGLIFFIEIHLLVSVFRMLDLRV